MNRTCYRAETNDCDGEVSLVLLPDNETHRSLCEEHMDEPEPTECYECDKPITSGSRITTPSGTHALLCSTCARITPTKA